MFFQMVTLTPSFSYTLVLGSFLNVDSPAQLNNRIRQPARKSLSAPVPLVPAAFFVGDDDDDDDKQPDRRKHQRFPALFDHHAAAAAAAKRIGRRMPMSLPPMTPFPLKIDRKCPLHHLRLSFASPNALACSALCGCRARERSLRVT